MKMVKKMIEKKKEAASEIAEKLRWAVEQLEQDPLKKAYVLREVEEEIKKLVQEKYSNDPEAVFLMFFYTNLRYHLWMHLAADASLRLTDSETERIINKIKEGLNALVESLSLERPDKGDIYNKLSSLVFGYLNELNKVGDNND